MYLITFFSFERLVCHITFQVHLDDLIHSLENNSLITVSVTVKWSDISDFSGGGVKGCFYFNQKEKRPFPSERKALSCSAVM